VLPYKLASASAKNLAADLRCKRLYPDERSRFRARRSDIIVNWGLSGGLPRGLEGAGTILNRPENVALSSDKLRMLQRLTERGIPTLEFTTDKGVVEGWLDEGNCVFARTLLNSHSGRGIIELDPQAAEGQGHSAIPYAPLYTKYIKKKHEYRVHVLPNGKTEIRQKRKRNGLEEVNSRVRNHTNGYNFCKELSFKPDDLEAVAIAATKALGLDFAALDILYNERLNKCFVIESNCAPGLENSTIRMYGDALRERIYRV